MPKSPWRHKPFLVAMAIAAFIIFYAILADRARADGNVCAARNVPDIATMAATAEALARAGAFGPVWQGTQEIGGTTSMVVISRDGPFAFIVIFDADGCAATRFTMDADAAALLFAGMQRAALFARGA